MIYAGEYYIWNEQGNYLSSLNLNDIIINNRYLIAV